MLDRRRLRSLDGLGVVTEKRKPILFVEAKLGDQQVAPALRYLKERFPDAAAWQIAANGAADYMAKEGIRVCPAVTWLATLV